MSENTNAFDRLGEKLPQGLTAAEALESANLANWNVRKAPAYGVDPITKKTIEMTGRNAVIRDDPETGEVIFMGDVGASYQIIQNEQHVQFLDTLVDESGSNFDRAGQLYGGRHVFVTMKLPGHIMIGGVDPIENYLAAFNSHDGSTSFSLVTTPVRVHCANMLNTVFGDSVNRIRIRHTAGLQSNMVTRVREALDISFDYLDEFQKTAEQMINTTLTESQFAQIIEKEFGVDEVDASSHAITRSQNKIESIMEIYSSSLTQDRIRGTAWAGYNALTEYADHHAPVRGENRDVARAQNSIFETWSKERALELMTAV